MGGIENGPKGVPWAQRLDLGWTIAGQMCLDRVGGPIHISARRTAVDILFALDDPRHRTIEEERPSVSLLPSEYQTVPSLFKLF